MSREPEGVKVNVPFDLLSAMICIAGLEQLIIEVDKDQAGVVVGGALMESEDVVKHLQSGIDLLNKIQSGNVFIFSDKETSK